MRKNFGAQPLLYPQPVLIIGTYDEKGTPNLMNAAWGGISDGNEISLSLTETHKTYKNILLKRAFTVSVATAKYVVEEDYVGIASGNKVENKFEKTGFHAEKSDFVDAPIVKELPVTLECTLKKINEDGIVVGEIVNVSADESVLGENGKIDVNKVDAISYDPSNHYYVRLGEIVGKAFSDGKKLM